MRLNYKTYGSGPPLLILHGLFGSLNNWQTVGKALSSARKVFLVDQRNHGNSFHSELHSYEAMAADIVRLMDTLGLAEAPIIGHSMGGKTAMTLALTHPGRVSKLIVVDISPRAYPPGHDAILDALCRLPLGLITDRSDADTRLAREVPELRVRQFLLTNLRRNEGGRFEWKMNLAVLKRNYREITRGIDGESPFPRPTLFIRGGKSAYLSRIDLPLIFRLFPQARMEELPEAGHWVHADAPEEFTSLVTTFLAERLGEDA